jgi:hypothetical protein
MVTEPTIKLFIIVTIRIIGRPISRQVGRTALETAFNEFSITPA